MELLQNPCLKLNYKKYVCYCIFVFDLNKG